MKKLSSLSVLAAGFLWGLMGIFVRHLNGAGLGSLEVAEVRITAGLLLLGCYLLLFRREMLRVRLRDLWCFFGTGIISLLLFSFCYFRAMAVTSLSVAAVLLYTAPVFVMLLSLILFREQLRLRKILALILAVSGCVLVSGLGSDAAVSLPGLLLGLGAGFFYALYSIFGRYAIDRGYSSWTLTFYTFLFCALGAAFLTDWGEVAAAVETDGSVLLWIAGMGMVTAFLPYVLYSVGLQHMESSRASILASIEPVVGTVVGVLAFREAVTAGGVAGVLLVLSAVAILSLPEGQKTGKSEQSVNNSGKRL